jgi:ABC-type uncharacterized transport system permease subunit
MYYMLGFPTLTVMGRINPHDFWPIAMQGLVVCMSSIVIMILMWKRGIKQFEAVGI